jgi:hypothetical protein
MHDGRGLRSNGLDYYCTVGLPKRERSFTCSVFAVAHDVPAAGHLINLSGYEPQAPLTSPFFGSTSCRPRRTTIAAPVRHVYDLRHPAHQLRLVSSTALRAPSSRLSTHSRCSRDCQLSAPSSRPSVPFAPFHDRVVPSRRLATVQPFAYYITPVNAHSRRIATVLPPRRLRGLPPPPSRRLRDHRLPFIYHVPPSFGHFAARLLVPL